MAWCVSRNRNSPSISAENETQEGLVINGRPQRKKIKEARVGSVCNSAWSSVGAVI